MRGAGTVRARYLRDGLKAENAAATEFAHSRQRIFQTVDLSQGIKFVNDEPQALILLRALHRFENSYAHPGRDCRAERCDLPSAIGNKKYAALASATSSDPFSY
jgi:hypothetical protein